MLHATLGDHVSDVVVTSTKSMTGHLLGGAGALESIATVLALHHRVVATDDQPRQPGPPGRARHRHQGPRPAARRHRRPEQLLRVRRRQRRRRLRFGLMTTAPAPAAAKPAKVPRDQDPRNPVTRLRALFDEGTLELITPDDDSGMLAAVGAVDGTRVVAFCSDATVMGGAMGDQGCKVVVDAYHRALTDRVPIIGLWHSGGARLAEGVLSLHAVGRIFQVMTQASGRIPQISVVLGPAAGGAAYGPALTDVVILGPDGRIFVTGPDVVRSVTGEDVDMLRLGGPEPHGRRSGVVHILTDSPSRRRSTAPAASRRCSVPRAAWPSTTWPTATCRGAARVQEAGLRRAPARRCGPRRGHDPGAARPLGAQHRDRARPVRRAHGRRRRQQPAPPGRLPGLPLGREGLPLRADVRRLRRPADRRSSTSPATCPASARSGTASYAAAPSCCTRSASAWCPGSPW